MLKPLVAAGGGLLVGVGLMAVFAKTPLAAPVAEKANVPRLPEAQPVTLAKSPSGANRSPAANRALPRVAPTASEGAAPRPDAPASDDQRPTDGFQAAEGDFFSESRDASWAQKTESLIVTIAQKFPATRATDVECRANHCRVTLSYPSIEAYNALFRGIAEDKTLAQGGMVASVGEGEVAEATVYIRRTN